MENIKITLEQIFLSVGQNNYDNKIPFLSLMGCSTEQQVKWQIIISKSTKSGTKTLHLAAILYSSAKNILKLTKEGTL